MADTKPLHGLPPVEGDGVYYRGIGWFVVVLVGTTLFCQMLVWGLFEVMEYRADRREPTRAPLAAPMVTPSLAEGRVTTDREVAGQPGLLVTEPLVLEKLRQTEQATLHSYGWVDQAAQRVRVPIDRAKDLLIERGGLRTRAGAAQAADAAPGPQAEHQAPPAAPSAPPAPAAGAARH
jgi:hypothetical protein